MQDFSCRTRIHCTATIAFVARYSFESLAPLLGYTACFEALSNSYGSLHLSSDDDDEELQEFDWRQVGECRERQDFPQSQSSQRGRCGGGEFQASTEADLDRAVQAARTAYRQWRLYPAPKRGEILFRAGELLLQRKEELARQMTREMGKVLSETRGDVQEAADTAFYMAGEGRRLFGHTTPSELRDKFAMSVRMPVGVCGMITPWNFPMAIPSWKLFPALMCGNTCVIKPAEDTPLSTFNLVELLLDAGLPEGVVNIVTGFGP